MMQKKAIQDLHNFTFIAPLFDSYTFTAFKKSAAHFSVEKYFEWLSVCGN